MSNNAPEHIIENFNPDALLQNLSNQYELRFREAGVPEEAIPRMVTFLVRMAQVAIQLAYQEKEIRIPNTEHAIPYDADTTTRVVELFSEGIAEALQRSVQLKLPDEASDMILQNVAQYVNETAKQVVLSTYGQENTPELQIPEEQQLELVYQTARSAFDHFVQQYEQQEGVSLTDSTVNMLAEMGEMMVDSGSEMDSMLADDSPKQDASNQQPERAGNKTDHPQQSAAQSAQPNSNVQSKSAALPIPGQQFEPVIHEKLAAVAMLLNSVQQEQGQQIFSMFNPEQQEVIRFYLDPTQVFQRLDMNAVLKQLHALKNRLFGEGSPGGMASSATPPAQAPSPEKIPEPTEAYLALKKLSEHVPKSDLMHVVQQERANIRQGIEHMYDDDLPVEALLSKASTKRQHSGLPPQVEALLNEHLQDRAS